MFNLRDAAKCLISLVRSVALIFCNGGTLECTALGRVDLEGEREEPAVEGRFLERIFVRFLF